MKVRPDVVTAAIADSVLAGLRVEVEQIPSGSRIRVHAAGDGRPSARRAELERQLARVVDDMSS